MRSVLASLALVLALGGCATIDEAFGRPDALEWTYFHGTPDTVVEAIRGTLTAAPHFGQRYGHTDNREEVSSEDAARVESVRPEGGGVVVTISSRRGSAAVTEVRVQATDIEGFTGRAQLYPQGRPLPRWLEIEINGRI